MRAGRIVLKIGIVPLIVVVAIVSGIVFVLSKAAGWILGPIILFVIACLIFCVCKQEWSQCLPLAIILAGSFGLLFGAGLLTEMLAVARSGLVTFLFS